MIGSICSLESGYVFFFFFKQKTAYEMRISDWSSDVCSSDLSTRGQPAAPRAPRAAFLFETGPDGVIHWVDGVTRGTVIGLSIAEAAFGGEPRSEEHTSELQSLMRISYAVFCLKKKKKHQ